MFFMNFKDIVIAGSSPETMVRLENGVATLRPIAGTRPRGKTEQEDRKLADELLNDEKEKASLNKAQFPRVVPMKPNAPC